MPKTKGANPKPKSYQRGVRLALIAGESCDHCNQITPEVLYAFKVNQPEGRFQLWLHNRCLRELTEKLWSMDAKRKREQQPPRPVPEGPIKEK